MVEFQCLRSGNKVSFDDPNDIESLRKHEGYKEIKHEKEVTKADEVPVQVPHEEEVLKVVKQRGRPKKVVVPVEDGAEI